MKRLAAILLAIVAVSSVLHAQNAAADSLRYAGLDSLLVQFYGSLEHETNDAKCGECDFLIASCTDSLMRNHVACNIFDHYSDSRLMGEEAVAVYIYDKWFAPGLVHMPDDASAFVADMFAEFNRNCLLYMPAPAIQMYTVDDEPVDVPAEGRLCVLYFYDTSCVKCKAVTALLPYLFDNLQCPLTFFALYTGCDGPSWQKFIDGFEIFSPLVTVVHLWDPEILSDYQRLYGVSTTPKMYLVEPGGTIIGRRLEPESLMEIINIYNLYLQYEED